VCGMELKAKSSIRSHLLNNKACSIAKLKEELELMKKNMLDNSLTPTLEN